MNEIIRELNILLKKNYDSLRSYRQIIKIINHRKLSLFFNQKICERYVFGTQLKNEIKRLGGKLYDVEEYEDYEINNWINKKVINDHNRKASLLILCEAGEKKCIKDYNRIIKAYNFSSQTERLLKSHKDAIAGNIWELQLKILTYQIDDITSKKMLRTLATSS